MKVFWLLRPFWVPYAGWGAVSLLAMGFLTLVGLVRPWLNQELVDRVIVGREAAALPWLTAAVLGVAVVRGGLHYFRQYAGHRFGQSTVYDLMNALYAKLQRLPFRFYDHAHTGDLMSRVTMDVQAVRQFLSFGLASLADVVFMVAFSIALMLLYSPRLTLATLGTLPLMLVLVTRFESRVRPAFAAVREALGSLSTVAQESITGVRTVKSFAREPEQVERLRTHNDAYRDRSLAASNLWARYFPAVEFLSQLGVTFLLWYGGRLVIRGELSLGALVAFFSLVWYLIWPVREVGYLVNLLTQAVAGGQRLVELLEEPEAIAPGAPGVPAHPRPQAASRQGPKVWTGGSVRGHVRFEGVSFQYAGGRPVLEGIDIDAPPGTVVALLGRTGSGKSTLVGLIPRFYDVTGGRITVDGVDVREMPLQELRRSVGIVMGDTFLWSASIRENIAFGRPEASDREVEEAARLAQADDFIRATPRGYGTVVGERGLGLSGGQKQRIAIARALICNPPILILDDATSSVDMETEREIQRALRSAMRGRTTFLIAHRLSTLRQADEILVLDGGRIVERGTHRQLLASGGLYRHIHDLQLQAEEYEAVVGR